MNKDPTEGKKSTGNELALSVALACQGWSLLLAKNAEAKGHFSVLRESTSSTIFC